MFSLFRRSANQVVIQRLYAEVVAASRQPILFSAFGVEDTVEGRFESLTLHAALVLRRLNALPRPGPDMAQDLIDAVFRHFDSALREMGIGDTVVPKRMKKMAEAFLGRSAAYDAALREGGDALALALVRNVVAPRPGEPVPADGAAPGARLKAYVEASVAALGVVPVQAFIDAAIPFPDPASFGGVRA